ncbi:MULTISPECIES: DsbA family oxidoreductase [Stenotrophomonas]|mgnify:CR=1 FL=1|jgi:predicted DsbA family dithiol-disulfide isomerase|uniref:DsbA family oxidoreductase n=1 Tax=Stenotrophomonas TaxID=40323 RepID=UPI00086F16B8|nr:MULTISPECIES: DsbA family oxidoreductase [Stenotrophomonas]ODU47374.1 MAG: polyketide synthase [Xanthomonadaceae bacterium SCN 69-123]OJY80048.1 MAG: polyketide synthase [Stenotrophomonas sp. 69-14]OZB51313.1 MAG: polyketide synthase [Stenotrophomonas sp. 14-69-23]MBN8801852.1 DsbA family oxidoreductase [Stenotrophomonas acidaminiphila]MCA7024101.1 DsbA family oxidoreductase [Stenotrophomonas acidaminiphila]
MRIDIWSDVVCPWCWIGKHRFQRALELMGDKAPQVEVRWHPFLLDPDADTTPVPLREAYAAKFGGAERTAQMLAQTQSTARAEGLPMDFDRGQVRVTTLPAHRLLWLAGREGVQEAVGEALFRAHFEQGRNLADPEVLAAAAAAGGIAAARVEALLASDEGLAEVRAGLGQAQALGIQSVPTFVINGRYAVQGAQPPEVFAQVLEKVAAELAPAPVAGNDEPACGADGCSV